MTRSAGLSIHDPARCYRDRSHKPEMLYALGPFELLAGFRRPDQVREIFDGLEVPGLAPVLAARDNSDPETALRTGFATVLETDPRLAAAWLTGHRSLAGEGRTPIARISDGTL